MNGLRNVVVACGLVVGVTGCGNFSDYQGRRQIAAVGASVVFALTCAALGWGYRKLQPKIELEEAQRIVAREFAEIESREQGAQRHGASSSLD